MMTLRSLALMSCVLLGICVLPSADAHQRSESASRWQITGQQLHMRLTIREAVAARLFADTSAYALPDAVVRHLASRLKPSADAGCWPEARLQAVEPAAGYLQVEAAWTCRRRPASLEIGAFFDLDPGHSHYASFVQDRWFGQKLLSADLAVWQLDAPDSSTAADNAYRPLLLQGVQHILSGTDHIVFLLALLLVCRRSSEAVWAVTGFTVGHSTSLALAVFGIVQPDTAAIEAAIGFTIILVLVERESTSGNAAIVLSAALLAVLAFSAVTGTAHYVPMLAGLVLFSFCYLLLARDVGKVPSIRIAVTALFGLVHGMGFATALLALDLPADRLAMSLLTFNLGVELGQLLLIGILALAWQATRHPYRLRPFAADLMAAAACGVGTYWFVSRMFAQ